MIIAVYSSHYLSFHSLRAFATFGKQRNLQISYLSASRLVTGLHDFQEQCQTVFHVMRLSSFSSKQCMIKQLLDSMFAISGIIITIIKLSNLIGYQLPSFQP